MEGCREYALVCFEAIRIEAEELLPLDDGKLSVQRVEVSYLNVLPIQRVRIILIGRQTTGKVIMLGLR